MIGVDRTYKKYLHTRDENRDKEITRDEDRDKEIPCSCGRVLHGRKTNQLMPLSFWTLVKALAYTVPIQCLCYERIHTHLYKTYVSLRKHPILFSDGN